MTWSSDMAGTHVSITLTIELLSCWGLQDNIFAAEKETIEYSKIWKQKFKNVWTEHCNLNLDLVPQLWAEKRTHCVGIFSERWMSCPQIFGDTAGISIIKRSLKAGTDLSWIVMSKLYQCIFTCCCYGVMTMLKLFRYKPFQISFFQIRLVHIFIFKYPLFI